MSCICCQEKINRVDYKEAELLRKFTTGQFRVKPNKYTGLCKKHQRKMANAIKIARYMALLPYTRNQTRRKT